MGSQGVDDLYVHRNWRNTADLANAGMNEVTIPRRDTGLTITLVVVVARFPSLEHQAHASAQRVAIYTNMCYVRKADSVQPENEEKDRYFEVVYYR